MQLPKKHRATLEAVFADPVRPNIAWHEIESIFEAYGAEISEGHGSLVRVALHAVRAVFHRPHPRKETDKGAVKAVRRFLIEPVRPNIAWHEIESIFEAYGAEISEGHGSLVRVALHAVRAVFHRPHPRKETDKGAVKAVRRFLIEAEIRP